MTKTGKSGVPLFFEEINHADRFAELFGIEDRELFNAAFKSVTEGAGREIHKINSVDSSALLCLLTFFPLYSQKSDLTLNLPEIGTVTFNRCFYEVRNKVIGFPSCVDVVLQSEDKNTLFFLESKLSEYEEAVKQETYGISYHKLYQNLTEMLNAIRIKECVDEQNDDMILTADDEVYIEGIKQTVSHLIGLVKGPQHRKDASYNSTEYEDAYKKAEKLVYGTILFNPKNLGADTKAFESYKSLYEIFATARDKTLKAIREWAGKSDKQKDITILQEILTYQGSFQQEYLNNLPEKVRTLYGL